jgi:hypothetical protein
LLEVFYGESGIHPKWLPEFTKNGPVFYPRGKPCDAPPPVFSRARRTLTASSLRPWNCGILGFCNIRDKLAFLSFLLKIEGILD